MSMPPPGGWQPPQQSGPSPNQGQPYGQPGYNPQQPPLGWPQRNWQQLGPPPPRGNSLKWLLIGVAVLLVIGITVGATLLFTRDGGGDSTNSPTSAAPSEFASANDNGPVKIVTDDPTCSAYINVNNRMAEVEANGWSAQRGELGPISQWNSDQKTQTQAVATAMRGAADQLIPLSKQTPHRLMRELYGQFIAYGRAYADRIDNYSPVDDGLATANVNIGSALASICNAISNGSASRAVVVAPAPAPTSIAPTGEAANPERFITTSDSTCTEWVQRSSKFTSDTTAWEALDASVPASEWTPERRAIEQSVQPLLSKYSDDLQAAGTQSGNPVLEDFAIAAALYLRAYISVGDSYTSADGWLSSAGFRITNAVSGACRAVAG
jgi:hypothetical protein